MGLQVRHRNVLVVIATVLWGLVSTARGATGVLSSGWSIGTGLSLLAGLGLIVVAMVALRATAIDPQTPIMGSPAWYFYVAVSAVAIGAQTYSLLS